MIRLAERTLTAIDRGIRQDGGNLFRAYLKTCMPECSDAYKQETDEFRNHLGASLIGRDCPRELWYTFRWATTRVDDDPRMQRLWNRGHLEEGRFMALLKMIGCKVYTSDENGKQYKMSVHNGHFGGSLDCVIIGCPDIPDEPILGECKTHNDKSFQKLIKGGVRSEKHEHFIQMQMYMGAFKLRYAIYLAVNKNDDDLYAEIIAFEPELFGINIDRAGKIVAAVTAPTKISQTPGWFKCKWCDHLKVCHMGSTPHRSCRTCRHSTPHKDAKWHCVKLDRVLDKHDQVKGCDAYERGF